MGSLTRTRWITGGRRFFPAGTPETLLRLVESTVISAGTLALVYQPANK
jgi:hypothetical protein